MKKFLFLNMILLIFFSCSEDIGGDVAVFNQTGTGGSTARFNITEDFLYIVNNNELKAFDISNEEDPVQKSTTNLGWGVETIFGYKGNLFIGTQTGMQIYGIGQDGSPSYISDFVHTTACDPVIANDTYAYITIRSGVACDNWLFEANQLITLNISDLSNPYEVDRDQMINPRGLAFFKGDLFVGEGDNGLKQFSLDDPANPTLIEFHDEIAANDMIPLDEILIITRDEGIFQFGYEQDSLLLLSPLK